MPDLDGFFDGFDPTLPASRPGRGRPPRLPAHPDGLKWGEKTREFWRRLWQNPRPEIRQVEMSALFRLACLVDEFERQPSKALEEEIKLLGRQFGI